MADSYDNSVGAAGAAYPASALPVNYLTENTLDFAAANRGAGDDSAMLKVKADSIVLFAGLEVLTLEGGTLTMDLGDDDDPNGYLDGVDGNNAIGDSYVSLKSYVMTSTLGDFDNEAAISALNVYSNVGGKFYQVDDTIDLINVDAADLAKVRVFAQIFDLKP